MKYRIYSLLLIFIFFNCSFSSLAQKASFSESHSLSLDSQYVYIKSLEYKYHPDELNDINESSIRAFIREFKEKCGENYDFLIFQAAPNPFGIVINPDTTIESQREYIETEERKYAPTNFKYYPFYQNCDLNRLINDSTVLILTRLSMLRPGKITMRISSLIPTPLNSSKSMPLNRIYIKLILDYTYTLELKEANNGMNAIYNNIASIEKSLKRYYSPPKNPRDIKNINIIYDNFAWRINNVSQSASKEISLKNLSSYSNIYELFHL